jgi:DNA-binding Xre family transcriptional regulator
MDVATLVRLRNALGCGWGDMLDGCVSGIVKARAKFLRIDTGAVLEVRGGAAPAADAGGGGGENGCAEDVCKIMGANLRRLREASKTAEGRPLSVEHLARLTALDHSTIWRFEHGKSGMTVATLVRLREAFGCEWGDLLDGCEGGIVKTRKRGARAMRGGGLTSALRNADVPVRPGA